MAAPNQYGIVSVSPPLAGSTPVGPNGIISQGKMTIKSTSNVATVPYGSCSTGPSASGSIKRGDAINAN